MSMESSPGGTEFLDAKTFLQHALGKLGVTNTAELEPRDRAKIAFAFHFDQCEKDEAVTAPQIVPDEHLTRAVSDALCWRSSQMLTLCMALIGFEDISDFEPGEVVELLDYS